MGFSDFFIREAFFRPLEPILGAVEPSICYLQVLGFFAAQNWEHKQ